MTLGVHPDEIVRKSNSPLLAKAPSWERKPLGQVAQVLNGFAFKSTFFNREGKGLPLIRIRDVGQDSTATHYSGPYEDHYVVEPGSLIIGMDGDFRMARWNGSPALLNQRVCKLTITDGRVLPEFVHYVLPGYLKAIHAHTSSVTVKHLSSRTLLQVPIPLPTLETQRRIVKEIEVHFTRLDAAVACLDRADANLRRLRAAVLAAAVTAGRMNVAALKRGWAWTTLEDVILDIRYGTSTRAREVPGGVPVLRMGNVVDGQLKLGDLKYLPADHREFPRLLLEPGDVLFNRTNSRELVGKATVYRGNPAPSSFASYLIRVRTDPSTLAPDFLCYFLNSAFGRLWASSVVSQQVGQANISGAKLRRLRIPLPPLEEQAFIVARTERHLSVLDQQLRGIATTLMRLDRTRTAVLSRAFSGKLVVDSSSSVAARFPDSEDAARMGTS